MDVLFVNAPIHWPQRIKRPIFPLGMAYVATAVRQAGHHVEVFDCSLHADHLTALEATLRSRDWEAVGVCLRDMFYYRTPQYPRYKQVLETIRRVRPHAKIVAGGTGFSVYSKEVMARTPEIDFGIFGEGEWAMTELLRNRFAPGINTFYRDGDEVKFTGVRFQPSLQQEAIIPIRDWPGLDLKKYDWLNWQTRRGCVFRCAHCPEPVIQGGDARPYGDAHLRREYEYLRSLGADKVFIVDTVFNVPMRHAMNVLDIVEGSPIRFATMLKSNGMTGELVRKLEAANFFHVWITFESGSARNLTLLDTHFRKETIERALEAGSSSTQMLTSYSFMLGFPDETWRDVWDTVRLMAKIKLRRPRMNWIGFEPLSTVPLTPLVDDMGHKSTTLDEYVLTNPRYGIYFPLVEAMTYAVEKLSPRNYKWRIARFQGAQGTGSE